MIIDFNTKVGKSLFGYKLFPLELLKLQKQLNIDKSVICPVKPLGYNLSKSNTYISKIVNKFPNNFIGFCRIDPWQGKKALTELKRAITDLNLKGLYLDPKEEVFQINSKIVYPLIEQINEYNIPVMINGGYINFSTAWQIADLAKRFPKVKFIATSGGQINISGAALWEAEIMLLENPNIYMETSGIYREDFIEEMVQKIGASRIIFGSNAPIYDMRLEIKRVEWAHISNKEKELILGKNAINLLNLQG